MDVQVGPAAGRLLGPFSYRSPAAVNTSRNFFVDCDKPDKLTLSHCHHVPPRQPSQTHPPRHCTDIQYAALDFVPA